MSNFLKFDIKGCNLTLNVKLFDIKGCNLTPNVKFLTLRVGGEDIHFLTLRVTCPPWGNSQDDVKCN